MKRFVLPSWHEPPRSFFNHGLRSFLYMLCDFDHFLTLSFRLEGALQHGYEHLRCPSLLFQPSLQREYPLNYSHRTAHHHHHHRHHHHHHLSIRTS